MQKVLQSPRLPKCNLMLSLFIGLGLSLNLIATAANAQSYPNRTVKMIVPLTAGSGADIAGRIVGKSLSETWKQSVIVENRPGAGGLIGTGAVVSAEPDGYTLLVQSASYAANPAIYKKLPYDPLKSLVDVDILGQTPYVLITSAEGPYQSIRDLVIAAKSKPGEIRVSPFTCTTPGCGKPSVTMTIAGLCDSCRQRAKRERRKQREGK